MDSCLCSLVEVGGLEAWISDGSCDDINNNAFCQFDGGDCCGANVRKQHCMDCQCLGNTNFFILLYLHFFKQKYYSGFLLIFIMNFVLTESNNTFFKISNAQKMKIAMEGDFVMNLEHVNAV